MTDTIFFDLDNTLLDFSRAERAALSKTLEALGVPPAEDLLHRYSQLNAAQWRLLEQGKITRPEVKLRRFRLLFEMCIRDRWWSVRRTDPGDVHYPGRRGS